MSHRSKKIFLFLFTVVVSISTVVISLILFVPFSVNAAHGDCLCNETGWGTVTENIASCRLFCENHGGVKSYQPRTNVGPCSQLGETHGCPNPQFPDCPASQVCGSDGWAPCRDIADQCPDTSTQDNDNDGIPNASDNCPDTPNPGQENNDGDALGNACDPLPDGQPEPIPPPPPGGTPGPIGGPTEVGIVPCGYGTLPPCNLCHFYNLAKNGIDFMLFRFLVPLAVIALLIGGIYLLASRGNPQMLETGKNAITNTVLGIIIAFAAWLVIATILNTLGYKGFTPGWSDPPVCQNPIKPISGGGIVSESCETPGESKPCTTSNGARGVKVCTIDKFFTSCLEVCEVSQIGTPAGTRKCDVGGCAGTQKCETAVTDKDGKVIIAAWSPKCTQDDPKCVPQGGGTCPTPSSGFCSTSALSTSCFGSALAHEAAQICGQESSNRTDAEGDSELSADNVPLSIGLFQILLPCHAFGSLDCPTAFEDFEDKNCKKPPSGKWKLKSDAASRTLYNNCVQAAKDPNANITRACQIRAARKSWADWSTAGQCNLL